jgi:hypothetical protein
MGRIDDIAGDVTNYFELNVAFREAAEEDEDGSVLALLAQLMLMMLGESREGERFVPMATWSDGSTTFLPSHLTDEQLTALEALEVDNVAVRTRISDVLWERLSGPSRVTHAHAAIDGYILLSERETDRAKWKYLRRAHDLAVRFRRADDSEREKRLVTLAAHAVKHSSSVGLLSAVSFIRSAGELDSTREFVKPALQAAIDASRAKGEFRRERRILEELARWALDVGERADLTSRIASSWEREADSRLHAESRSAMVAASFIEESLQALRAIPRRERARLDVDQRIRNLRVRLSELNEEALDEMGSFTTDPVDLSHAASDARRRVSGHPWATALLLFSRAHPLSNESDARTEAEESIEGTLARLFSHTTFTSDGRVADKSGEGEAVDRQMATEFQLRIELISIGILLPALHALREEHSPTLADWYMICRESAVVPWGRERLIAAGLAAGWNHEFEVAVHLFAPQTEAIVRHHLKAAGVFTSRIDEEGIEDELSLPALLEKPEIVSVFGDEMAYELRSIYTARFGMNLRHNIAHGLVSDSIGSASIAVYAWWLTLRLVVTPFWNRATSADEAPPSQPDEPETI